MSCGIAVGEGQSAKFSAEVKYPHSQNRNIIEFDENKEGRRFRADIGDDAIESIGQPLAYILGTRLTQQNRKSQPNNADEDTIEGQLIPIASASESNETSEQNTSASPKALPVSSDLALLNQIFRDTSEKKLKLADSRLKQTSQRDFVIRVSVLFFMTHEGKGRNSIPRAELNELLEDSKVYDSNARTWITNTDLLMLDAGSISLSRPGREHAHKILQEIRDESIETRWKLDSRNRQRNSRKRTVEANEVPQDNKESRKKRNDSYTTLVRQLIEEGFFSEEHSGDEVNTELTRRGYKFELRHINQCLVNLIKKTPLTRDKDASGSWKYQVK